MTLISKIFNYSINTLVLLLISIMLISSLSFFESFEHNFLLLLAISTVMLSLLLFISVKLNRQNHKHYLFFLFLISFLSYFSWNLYAQSDPVSDYSVLLEGAHKIINGTFSEESFNKSNYFYFYNYQIGYSVYLALLIKLFGDSIVTIKIFEAASLFLTSFTMYKIIKKIHSKDSAAIGSIFYATFIPNIMGVSVINNQHISTLLLCLSILFLLNFTKKSILISGILLAFSNIMRPASIILIIAYIMLCIYLILQKHDYKHIIKLVGIFLLAFFFTVKLFDFTLMTNRISPSPISKSNAKYFKFVLGLKGSGVYNIESENARKTQVYFDLEHLNFNYDEYNAKCLETIDYSLSNFAPTYAYVKEKMRYFLGYKDNQFYFALSSEKVNDKIYLLINLGQIQYICLLSLVLIFLLLNLKKGENTVDIFLLLLIGFILVHLFIEAQTRYRYELYAFMPIIAAKLFPQKNSPRV